MAEKHQIKLINCGTIRLLSYTTQGAYNHFLWNMLNLYIKHKFLVLFEESSVKTLEAISTVFLCIILVDTHGVSSKKFEREYFR